MDITYSSILIGRLRSIGSGRRRRRRRRVGGQGVTSKEEVC